MTDTPTAEQRADPRWTGLHRMATATCPRDTNGRGDCGFVPCDLCRDKAIASEALALLSTVEAERDRLRDIADRRNHVMRVEVIDHRAGAERFGRAFVAWDAAVSLSYQDGSRTLKVFVDDPVSGDPQGNQT